MLFGHQTDDTTQPTGATNGTALNPLAVDPATGASLPTAPVPPAPQAEGGDEPSILNQPGSGLLVTPTASDTEGATVDPLLDSNPVSDAQTTSTGAASAEPNAEEVQPEPAPVEEPTAPDEESPSALPAFDTSVVEESGTVTTDAPADNNNLLDLKRQALEQLSPLVDQLDQTPEERFRTTMMLIQSTDNSSLIGEAYEAAQAISDEKARAQALLDIINEINYFTQQAGN